MQQDLSRDESKGLGKNRLKELFRGFDPSLLGFFFPSLWFTCIPHQTVGSVGAGSFRIIIYGSSIVLCVAVIVFNLFSRSKKFPSILDIGFCCAMVASSVMLSLDDAPLAVYQLASVLGGMGYCWALFQWGLLFASMRIEQMMLYIFLSRGVSNIVLGFMFPLPAWAYTIVFVALPILSLWSARRANLFYPAISAKEVRFGVKTTGSLWRVAVGVGTFSFVFGFVNGLSPSNVYDGDLIFRSVGHILGIAMVVLALYWVLSKRTEVYASKLWICVLFMMAVTLVLLTVQDPTIQLVGALISLTAQTFARCLLWATLADVARYSSWHPLTVFSAGWILYAAPLVAGESLQFATVGFGSEGTDLMLALCLLMASIVLLLNTGTFSRQRIFQDLEYRLPVGRPVQSIDEACGFLAKEYKLSPRETEVLTYFAKGRAKRYIAETLFVSENTVKVQIKSIYGKMDIHSKQELLDAVDSAMQKLDRLKA